jgi:crotonobetainyl-CoA:carnitine CoA-transferase CaiB-like acyl-CoA transferase
MDGSLVLERRESGIAVLTLNRQDKLNALSDAMVADLARLLDELASDPSLRVLVLTGAGRVDQHDRSAWPALRERFAAIFRTRTRDDWVRAAAGRDACLSPVLSIDEAPSHPQMAARGVFSRFDGVLHPTPAPRLARTPASLRRGTPAPGQHQEEVARDWALLENT